MASTLELFNQTVIDVLAAPPMCQVTITSNKTFTPGFPSPPQVLNWDGLLSPTSDPYGMWSSGTPSRITPPVAGWYMAIGIFDWADSGGNTGSRIINFNKNGGGVGTGAGGTSTFAQATLPVMLDNAFIFTMTMNGISFFNGTTDYVEVYGWQNWTGNNTTIQPGRTAFTLVKVHL